jgi:hypothetical protein
MSEPAPSIDQNGWGWLPPRLRPRERELPARRLWPIETAVLVLVGLVLAIATGNDVARSSHINERLNADLSIWRHYTGHDFHNVSVDVEIFGPATHRDVVCGNTSGGAPRSTPQLCLVVSNTAAGKRAIGGGWYLPKYVEDNSRPRRYGCFGREGAGQCPS